MSDISITLPIAMVMTIGGSLLTVGGAWAVMRTRLADTRQQLDKYEMQFRTDLREVFNRLSELEREALTRKDFAEFRKEIVQEIHALRDLIEKLRPARAPKASE
jgi:hypothetical protein